MNLDTDGQDKGRRLGRGLGALIASSAPVVDRDTSTDERVRSISLERIRPNPHQPRRAFDESELRELELSLSANGLLQPVTVRPRGSDYELIAGERRLRAAKRLGWTTIAAIVREVSDNQLLTLALVENLQRDDLNAIEEAEGYRQLSTEFGLTQQQVADAVGKDRSTVSNMMRLLLLPVDVQDLVRAGSLSVGHARALLGLPDGAAVSDEARRIVQEGLTVRQVEQVARAAKAPSSRARATLTRAASAPLPPEARLIADRLRRALQTDVQIVANAQTQGEVRIKFYSADDLDRLVELIAGPSTDLS